MGMTAGKIRVESKKDDTTHVAIICGKFDCEIFLFASSGVVAPSLDSASLTHFLHFPLLKH